MPILEILAVKGLIVTAKAIAAKGLAAKVGVVLAKSFATWGLSQTVVGVTTVGLVVGGLSWTRERIDNLGDVLRGLESGDKKAAVMALAALAINSHLAPELLPDAVSRYLLKIHVSQEKANKVAEAVASLEGDVADAVSALS